MHFLRVFVCTSIFWTTGGLTTWGQAGEPIIHFDLPPIAVARTLETGNSDSLVTIELKLSSMIATPDVPRIDQWLVQCQPRDTAISIADYAPRTEVASEVAGAIQVKKTNENTKSVGLAVDGAYGKMATAHSGFDQGSKDINSYQFDRIAPVQAVTASGTINRGRGVYFKLRWTAQQVLEGEKTFQLTLRVPPNWRGGLLDVSVVAQSERKSFPGWDSETETLGAADFVIAAYRQGDHQVAALARQLFDAEHELRNLALQHRRQPSHRSVTSLLRHVAMKLDVESVQPNTIWINRLLQNRADPHLDKEIRKLPMPVRVAVLDYVEIRDDFLAVNRSSSPDVVAAATSPSGGVPQH